MAKLEIAVLRAVAAVHTNDWAAFYIGALGNTISGSDGTLARVTTLELMDCLCALSKRGKVTVRKFENGNALPLLDDLCSDTNYVRRFFGQGDFQVRLTHEGRGALGHLEVSLADNMREADRSDDLLPIDRRRVFDADLPLRVQVALREGHCLVMIMIDLDHFREVNNQHGHAVGDETLIGVAKIIEARVRGKGRAYRYGGEEIAVLLPNYTVEEGIALAEAIRREIERSSVSGKNLKVTTSLGLACVPLHAPDAEGLAKRADEALYDAKRLGRNLVRVYGEPAPERQERTPTRREAVPGDLSDEEREAIRLAHYSGERPMCPRDGMPLRIVKEFHSVGRRTPGVIVTCPACGLQEVIEGPY